MKTNGKIIGITQPQSDEKQYKGILGFLRYLLDHQEWRDNNKESDEILKEYYGKKYWRNKQ